MNQIQKRVLDHFVSNGMTESQAKLEVGEMSELELEQIAGKIQNPKENETMAPQAQTIKAGKNNKPVSKPVKKVTAKPTETKTPVKASKTPVKEVKAEKAVKVSPAPTKPSTAKTSKPEAVKPKATAAAKPEKVVSKEKQAAKDKLAAKTKPAAKKNLYTRSHALLDALKKGGTQKEIIERAQGLFMNHKNKSHGNADKSFVNTVTSSSIPLLLLAGVITKDEKGKYKVVK